VKSVRAIIGDREIVTVGCFTCARESRARDLPAE
jgi:hypothetical protein